MDSISAFWDAVGYALYLCLIIVLARLVLEITHQFSRSWRPAGLAAIGIELVYACTDPPIRLLRRVIPPLHLGAIVLDLSIMILLLTILALYWVVLSLV